MPNGQAGFDPNKPYQATAKGGFDPNAPYSAATTGNAATPSAAPERPGFFNRMSEQLGLTAHPLDQAKAELGMLYHHPLTTLEETGKNALSAVTGVPRNADWSIRGAFKPGVAKNSLEQVGGLPGMVMHPIRSTGSDTITGDLRDRNYGGALGTFLGDVLPFAAGSPEVRGAVADTVRNVTDRAADVRGHVGESIRTPEGKLKTMPKVGSQIAGGVGGAALGAPLGHEYIGAAAGYKLGPTLLESFFPDPNAELRARGAFMNRGYKPVESPVDPELERQQALGAFMNKGYLPSAEEPATVPFKPFKPSESVSRQMRGYGTYDPLQSSPSYAQAPSRSTVGAGASSGQSGATGSAAQPFEPLIWQSPEDAAAHDFQMQNIQRQASSAGKYHAAQGAAGKRTNLQQRIGRKGGFFYGDQ